VGTAGQVVVGTRGERRVGPGQRLRAREARSPRATRGWWTGHRAS